MHLFFGSLELILLGHNRRELLRGNFAFSPSLRFAINLLDFFFSSVEDVPDLEQFFLPCLCSTGVRVVEFIDPRNTAVYNVFPCKWCRYFIIAALTCGTKKNYYRAPRRNSPRETKRNYEAPLRISRSVFCALSLMRFWNTSDMCSLLRRIISC